MKIRFVVVDEYRSSDVHGVDQTKAFRHAAPVNEFLDLRRDIDEPCRSGTSNQRYSVSDFIGTEFQESVKAEGNSRLFPAFLIFLDVWYLGATEDCVAILILKRELGLTLMWHYKIPHTAPTATW